MKKNTLNLNRVGLFLLLMMFAFIGVSCGGGNDSLTKSNVIPPTPPTPPAPPIDKTQVTTQVTNLSETIVAGVSYQVTFVFTNVSSSPLNITSIMTTFSTPANFTQISNTCGNTTMAVNGTCKIVGTFSMSKPNTSTNVSVALKTNNATTSIFQQNVYAVAAPSGNYFILRIKNTNPHDTIYMAASQNDTSGNSKMLSFASNGYGTLTNNSSDGSTSWNTYAVPISNTFGSTFYIPMSATGGGKLYLSVNNKLSNGGAPNPTGADANNNNTQWQEAEFAFVNTKAQAFIDISNVNLMSIPLQLNANVMANTAAGTPTGYSKTAGVKYNTTIPMSTVLNNVKSALATWPTSWGMLSSYNGTSGQLLRIISSVSLPNLNTSTFDTSNYTPYINDLWSYYTGIKYVYVDATEIAALAGGTSSCILQGQVDTNHSDANYNLMVFSVQSGSSCPTNSVTGTPTQTFTKFTAGDFLLGAPGSSYTLWGDNQTYRSVIGRDIVAAQSVGFLPYCSQPNLVLSQANFIANSGNYYTPQYNCLYNYSSYTNSVINQYAHQNAVYFTYYGYPYSDILGEDNTLNIANNTTDPITLTVLKLN